MKKVLDVSNLGKLYHTEKCEIIAIKDISNSIADILQSRNAKKQMIISFDSIDSEIKKLKAKVINAQMALLLLKFQLGDIDYLVEFFSSDDKST